MTKWAYFIVLQLVLAVLVAGGIYLHKDKILIVKTPPKSLAQWYKPENKRQVWLHNMFKLRREMQAVKFYAENKNDEHLKKWSTALNDHYLKIAEMVPSWENKLDLASLENVKTNVQGKKYEAVISSVNALQQNCDSCHQDYQAITALTYRSADFTAINVEPSISLKAQMQDLSQQVNQIKIASGDGMPDLALSSLADLKRDMNKLGQVCTDCHKKDRKDYPSEQMNNTLISLEQNLKTGTIREQSMDLGTLAVLACAQCHGTHRLPFGAKKLLSQEQTLKKLLAH